MRLVEAVGFKRLEVSSDSFWANNAELLGEDGLAANGTVGKFVTADVDNYVVLVQVLPNVVMSEKILFRLRCRAMIYISLVGLCEKIGFWG